MGKVLVLYHSQTGNTATMTRRIERGAAEVPGMETRLRSIEEPSAEDVLWCDGLALGSPTNMGLLSWSMKRFWDETMGGHWMKIDGKIGCAFSSSGGWGGELYVRSLLRLVNCIFNGNAAVCGGGILGSPEEVIGCTFEGNHASENGGRFNGGGRTAIIGCRFLGNSAGRDGGGIYNLDTSQGPTLVNCLLAHNTAERRGGGMLNDETAPRIQNSTEHLLANPEAFRSG